jgi:hypothetical protein
MTRFADKIGNVFQQAVRMKNIRCIRKSESKYDFLYLFINDHLSAHSSDYPHISTGTLSSTDLEISSNLRARRIT